jgi:hypothetical protein
MHITPVLQESEVTHIGGEGRVIKVDVKAIARPSYGNGFCPSTFLRIMRRLGIKRSQYDNWLLICTVSPICQKISFAV